MSTTIEFCIFELVWLPDFSLNWQFQFFEPNLLNNIAVCIFGIQQTTYDALASRITEQILKIRKLWKHYLFYHKYTKCTIIAWLKIWKLWVNPKKNEWRKKAIQRRFTKANITKFSHNRFETLNVNDETWIKVLSFP